MLKSYLLYTVFTIATFAAYIYAEDEIFELHASLYCDDIKVDYVTCSQKELGVSTCSYQNSTEQFLTAEIAGALAEGYIRNALSIEDTQMGCKLRSFSACEQFMAEEKRLRGNSICVLTLTLPVWRIKSIENTKDR